MAGMSDKELAQVEQDLRNKLTQEEETDNMIVSAAEEITAALFNHQSACPYTINDVEYLFRYYIQNNTVVVLVVNRQRYEISNGKLGLQKACATMEDNMTEKQCLMAAVEGYIRHITGNIKPEMMDDE